MATVVGGLSGGLGKFASEQLLGRAASAATGAATDAADTAEQDAASAARGAACGLSFSADTQVATPGGERAISALKVGDAVDAYDPTTGKASVQTVEQVYVNHDRDLVDVTLRTTTTTNAAGGRATVMVGADDVPTRAALQAARQHQLATPTTHDETIHTTLKHPWLTADRSWVTVGGLHLGERVERADGTTAVVVSIHLVPGAAAMWDLTVSRVHTFVVGTGEYVVHNCGDTLSDGTEVSLSTRRLEHSFDSVSSVTGKSHAEEWFGRQVSKVRDMPAWQATIRKAMRSTLIFDSQIGGEPTTAVLARVQNGEGGQMQWFVVHFFKDAGPWGDAGSLASAFRPDTDQWERYMRALGNF